MVMCSPGATVQGNNLIYCQTQRQIELSSTMVAVILFQVSVEPLWASCDRNEQAWYRTHHLQAAFHPNRPKHMVNFGHLSNLKTNTTTSASSDMLLFCNQYL